MRGKMYLDKWNNEFIVFEELYSMVALVETDSQTVIWVTRNILQRDYTLKKPKEK